MKRRKLAALLLIGWYALACAACASASEKEENFTPRPASTPQPLPLIAYLHEGSLWVIEASGNNARLLVASPSGEAINAHVWSLDGSRCYFSVGLHLFSVALRDRKLAEAGELIAPSGATIERLEMAGNGTTLIAFVMPATADFNTAPKPFAVTVGQPGARELTVDEYRALAASSSPIVRGFDDLAVSPDGRSLLFKEMRGHRAELFISDLETGARHQVTDLNTLDGFEPSATLNNERQILEAAWSPDSRYVIFNPAQSCSEIGLCYGRLFLVSAWGGPQFQLSREMMVNLPVEWSRDGTLLTYDDGGQVLIADTRGQIKRLTEGNRPRWQPEKQ